MNNPLPQSALREWRANMAHAPRAASLLGVAIIVTLIAPFETDSILRPAPRFTYWLVIVLATYSIGFFANSAAIRVSGPESSLLERAVWGTLLSMAHGPDIPNSRANVAKIREAGHLPK